MQQRLTRKVAAVSLQLLLSTLYYTLQLLRRTQHKFILIEPYI